MLYVTQARAKVRALVGAVLSGSAIGFALFAAAQFGPASIAPSTDEPAAVNAAGFKIALPAADELSATPEPRLIKAGILPEFTVSAATLRAVDPFRDSPLKPRRQANAQDMECLTEAVYFESRGQPLAGQAAVAQVILNRSRHPAYPKSVCGVIYQGRERGSCQFSFACHRRAALRESPSWREAREIASAALDGTARDVVGTATSFHATRVRPNWPGMIRVSTVGQHVFYRFSGAKGATGNFSGAAQPSREREYARPSRFSATLAAVKRPIQAALSAPAVQTATPPPAPVIALPSVTFQPAMKAAAPVVAPANVPTAEPAPSDPPAQAATLQPASAPTQQAVTQAHVS